MKQSRVKRILKQLDSSETCSAKKFYTSLLLKYWTYQPTPWVNGQA